MKYAVILILIGLIILPVVIADDSCVKYYTCPDGSQVQYCEIKELRDAQGNVIGGGCGCKDPASLCPVTPETPKDTCTKYYTCADGTKIEQCKIVTQYDDKGNVIAGGCACKTDPASSCPKQESLTIVYFKSCSHIWDSSPYVNQIVNITASIKDSIGNSASDSVSVKVLDQFTGIGGGAYPMDGKKLEIQIVEPSNGNVGAGAVEIKISSKGPNELGDMLLTFAGDNWGGAFPISNRNCVAGASGGGGDIEGYTKCEKYYNCPDGKEIQYCFVHKMYNDNGELIGAGCGCKTNPESLCESSSGSGGGGVSEPIPIPRSESGGGGNATPIICNGCILGDKCVPIGYRANEKYCDINSELLDQKEDDLSCENNFECETNLCIDNKCLSSNLWQKILRFFERLFG